MGKLNIFRTICPSQWARSKSGNKATGLAQRKKCCSDRIRPAAHIDRRGTKESPLLLRRIYVANRAAAIHFRDNAGVPISRTSAPFN
jgi:hypothetical protein